MKECQCEICQYACKHKPGWFLPGEAEKAAEFLGLTMPEFFAQYLGVDWWAGGKDGTGEDIFVLAPATTAMVPGEMYPADPRGQCVFFAQGLCQIHPVKPFECAAYGHEDKREQVQARHRQVAQAWQPYQEQIAEWLGHKPHAAELDLFDLFSLR